MKNFKFNWGHGVVLALGGFILFILTLILSADVSGDLVSDDYYNESLEFQEENIDAKQRANALSQKPEIITQANGYNIKFAENQNIIGGEVFLMRGAYKEKDVRIPIKLDNRNQILVPAAKLEPGEYELMLKWYDQDSLVYLVEKTLKWTSP